MNITDINFAIDVLSHPQSGDKSDINKALNVAIELLKAGKEIVEQECVLDKIRAEIEELDGRYVIGDYGIYGENIPKYVRFCDVVKIIDKYKAGEEYEDN